MLTQTQNDRYTRVGPGTPCGELMRRYWHPVAAAAQMKDKFTMQVRILGEDLILYKDRGGVYGLIDPFCLHRRMNMIYGIPEDRGLRCPYHGWCYDETGQCIEQPYEEAEGDSRFKDKIKLKAYPVREQAGIPHTLQGLKVADDKVDLIVKMAPEDPTAGGNPVKLDRRAARTIFMRALEGRL